jgi:hypothetical protein
MYNFWTLLLTLDSTPYPLKIFSNSVKINSKKNNNIIEIKNFIPPFHYDVFLNCPSQKTKIKTTTLNYKEASGSMVLADENILIYKSKKENITSVI